MSPKYSQGRQVILFATFATILMLLLAISTPVMAATPKKGSKHHPVNKHHKKHKTTKKPKTPAVGAGCVSIPGVTSGFKSSDICTTFGFDAEAALIQPSDKCKQLKSVEDALQGFSSTCSTDRIITVINVSVTGGRPRSNSSNNHNNTMMVNHN